MILASALDTQMGDVLASAGPILFYLVVWGLVFAGTGLFVGVFIPFITGDSLLFAAGLVTASAPNDLNVVILAIGVGIAAFVGDQVGFIMGRHLGRPYLDKKAGPNGPDDRPRGSLLSQVRLVVGGHRPIHAVGARVYSLGRWYRQNELHEVPHQ